MMIKITIESVDPSSHPLFRVRGITIVIQIVCMIFHIVNAAAFSIGSTRPTWITFAILAACAAALCAWDLINYETNDTTSSSSKQPQDAEYEEIEAQQSSSAAVSGMSEDEASMPFLRSTLLPSTSKKTDEPDVSNALASMRLNTTLIAAETFLVFGFLATYIANMIVESLSWDASGYFFKVHVIMGTVVAVILHVYCLSRYFDVLKKTSGRGQRRRSTKPIRI